MKKIMTTLLIALLLAISPRQVLPKITSSSVEEMFQQNIFIGFPAYSTKNLWVCSSSSSKTYMDWTKTSATSRQGKFMREHMTVRDGLLYDKDNFIGVALGSYFGVIGDRFVFTLSTGIVLKLIKVEEKSDWHTNNGCEQKWDHSVIEFVIDTATNKFPYFSNDYIANGNYNNLEQFKGNIAKIEKVLN